MKKIYFIVTLIFLLSLQLKEATVTPPTMELRFSDKMSFPREIYLKPSEIKLIPLYIFNNNESKDLFFKLDVYFDETNSDPGFEQLDVRYPKSCLSLLPTNAILYDIFVEAPSFPPLIPGTFALRADVLQYTDDKCITPDPIQPKYDTRLSFITIDNAKRTNKFMNWFYKLLSHLKSWF